MSASTNLRTLDAKMTELAEEHAKLAHKLTESEKAAAEAKKTLWGGQTHQSRSLKLRRDHHLANVYGPGQRRKENEGCGSQSVQGQRRTGPL